MLLQVLLHKYTAQDDIIVGTPYANRDAAEVQGLMGPFLNTLAMRLDLAGDPSFNAVVSRAKAAATQAFLHGSAPFAKVVDSLGAVRSAAFTPIYQVQLLRVTKGQCSICACLLRSASNINDGCIHETPMAAGYAGGGRPG